MTTATRDWIHTTYVLDDGKRYCIFCDEEVTGPGHVCDSVKRRLVRAPGPEKVCEERGHDWRLVCYGLPENKPDLWYCARCRQVEEAMIGKEVAEHGTERTRTL